MNDYYKQKENEIKSLIYDSLCITEDKHITTKIIYGEIIDNINMINDLSKNY